jgi:equilibrative nucleoside transporter 1/2/3
MLLPMNFYFNADGYWKYKFRNTTVDGWQEAPLTDLQIFWGSHISIVSMAPNFLFLLFNVLFGARLATRPRVLLPLALNVLLFLLSALLTQLNTDPWQSGFYGLTLAFALLFNISDSVYQVTGLLAMTSLPCRAPSPR